MNDLNRLYYHIFRSGQARDVELAGSRRLASMRLATVIMVILMVAS
jgi:hypothetical protein